MTYPTLTLHDMAGIGFVVVLMCLVYVAYLRDNASDDMDAFLLWHSVYLVGCCVVLVMGLIAYVTGNA